MMANRRVLISVHLQLTQEQENYQIGGHWASRKTHAIGQLDNDNLKEKWLTKNMPGSPKAEQGCIIPYSY